MRRKHFFSSLLTPHSSLSSELHSLVEWSMPVNLPRLLLMRLLPAGVCREPKALFAYPVFTPLSASTATAGAFLTSRPTMNSTPVSAIGLLSWFQGPDVSAGAVSSVRARHSFRVGRACEALPIDRSVAGPLAFIWRPADNGRCYDARHSQHNRGVCARRYGWGDARFAATTA